MYIVLNSARKISNFVLKKCLVLLCEQKNGSSCYMCVVLNSACKISNFILLIKIFSITLRINLCTIIFRFLTLIDTQPDSTLYILVVTDNVLFCHCFLFTAFSFDEFIITVTTTIL